MINVTGLYVKSGAVYTTQFLTKNG